MTQKRTTAYVFLDTNIYLQFRDFDQIDWPAVLGYIQVCIVLAPVTLTELESFKYDPKSERRQSRSRRISKKLDRILFSVEATEQSAVPGRANVTLLGLTNSPDMSIYTGLKNDVADDQLIGSIIQFTTDNPTIEQENILLVADDAGCLNKARARKIVVKRLDDQFRLPIEPSATQKELTNLKRQLQELQAKQPRLSLVIMTEDGPTQELSASVTRLLEPDISVYEQLYNDEVGATHWEARESQRELDTTDDGSVAASLYLRSLKESLAAANGETILQEEIDRYQHEREQYLNSFKKFLRDLYTWEEKRSRSHKVMLAVMNDGTVPARGVVVRFVISDEITVHEGNLPQQPRRPKRPALPRTAVQSFMDRMSSSLHVPHPSDYRLSPTPNIDPDTLGPKIIPHNSVLLEWERSKVMHHIPLDLPPLALEFSNIMGVQEYDLPYEIIADSVPMPVAGRIRLEIVLKEQTFDIAQAIK